MPPAVGGWLGDAESDRCGTNPDEPCQRGVLGVFRRLLTAAAREGVERSLGVTADHNHRIDHWDGRTWCASSITIQCGRPVPLLSSAIAGAAFAALRPFVKALVQEIDNCVLRRAIQDPQRVLNQRTPVRAAQRNSTENSW